MCNRDSLSGVLFSSQQDSCRGRQDQPKFIVHSAHRPPNTILRLRAQGHRLTGSGNRNATHSGPTAEQSPCLRADLSGYRARPKQTENQRKPVSDACTKSNTTTRAAMQPRWGRKVGVTATTLAGLALWALSATPVWAACPNSCSGHGLCGASNKCTCFPGWTASPDCQLRTCAPRSRVQRRRAPTPPTPARCPRSQHTGGTGVQASSDRPGRTTTSGPATRSGNVVLPEHRR